MLKKIASFDKSRQEPDEELASLEILFAHW